MQQQIYNNVIARGYHDGYSGEVFAVRQVVKALEEVCELYLKIQWRYTGDRGKFGDEVAKVRRFAMMDFDNPRNWEDPLLGPIDVEAIANEAADCYVTLACLAEGLGFDLEQRAVVKSGNDVDRGIR